MRACACATLLVAATAEAQTFSSRSRSDLFSNQTALMDRRLSSQYAGSGRLAPAVAGTRSLGGQEVIPRYSGSQRSEWIDHARVSARRHGVPEDLFLRLIRQESGWNPGAVSRKGALGLTQLMPATAATLGVNPNDPRQNLDGGARYLALQYRNFGSWRLALAAYNAGPGAVQKHNGIPPYDETQNYVVAILGR
ncbi:Soluble lytic murein transglycosylase precursor [Jannaschia rubra]|uniref:Soluble lytic murein transglycosylase n=2 Tax=Jannaschia rubra TaxID=282197 RepID=A0A0M6XNV9_9RHOB|nr:lytic transglycosylase domain-containing protein [Jannaschia rubra]CTQ32860.1 Soluble lytic murein transglycosylase precursor [Jannaschia rubra]SFG29069.1 Transglycosylase SLT domain-containing protein [Jannaschia rubra]